MPKLEDIAKEEFKWVASRMFGLRTLRNLILSLDESEASKNVKFLVVSMYDRALFWIAAFGILAFLFGVAIGIGIGVSLGTNWGGV